jgi:molybdenum-dependent DNA-binding transcriptional regulator ModE
MPAAKYLDSRSDGRFIGKSIREIVRLMVEQEFTLAAAAKAVGLKYDRAYKAVHKPSVVEYRRQRKKELTELLSTRVPLKLSQLMDSENHAAATRAAIALHELNNEARAEPMQRRIECGGIVIMMTGNVQHPLPPATPTLESN